jgi:hypothetical protein
LDELTDLCSASLGVCGGTLNNARYTWDTAFGATWLFDDLAEFDDTLLNHVITMIIEGTLAYLTKAE